MSGLHVGVGGWLHIGRPDGASLRLRQLVRHAVPLLQPGERITWLAGPAGVPTLPDGVDIVPTSIPYGPLRARARAQRRDLPALIERRGIDVLENPCLPLPPLPRELDCALVTTIHDLRDLHTWRRRPVPAPLMRHLYRRQLRRAQAVFAPSQATLQDILTHGLCAAAQLHVVPNGTPVVATPRTPTAPPFALHVGHLEPRKNIELALDAFALLAQRNVPGRLIVAGEDAGSGASLRRRAHALGIGDRVVFVAPVSNEQRDELYRTCSAVLVPSHLEGFGLAALEGLAWGAPTLVSTDPALREVVGDAGTILEPSPTRWADALQDLLRAPTTQGDVQRKARAAQWSWSTAAAAWLTTLRSLTGWGATRRGPA